MRIDVVFGIMPYKYKFEIWNIIGDQLKAFWKEKNIKSVQVSHLLMNNKKKNQT